MSKGKLYLFISAFLYGILPVFASIAYRGGINGVTLVFLRSSISVPLLYVMIKADKKSFHLTRKQRKSIIYLALVGGSLPLILLYLSYTFIPTGLATTLHFTYPLIIVLASSVIYHQKISRTTLCSVIFVTIGIFMFSDMSIKMSKIGIILALLSGVFYSFYMIYLDYAGLDRMDFVVLTFYLMVFMSVATFLFGLVTDSISFDFSALSWSFGVLISLVTTLGAMPLLQIGIRYEGAANAGIISAIEPITSTVAGAMFLGEFIGMGQVLGSAMILMGVLLLQKREKVHISR